jgi:uncharacterized damage-inducible protein DinB
MNTYIKSIIQSLEETTNGHPWFGRSVYAILEEVDPTTVYIHPGNNGHSLIELLYHMITWVEFTCDGLKGEKGKGVDFFEELDWRNIDPIEHTWEKGLQQFKQANKDLISVLNTTDDAALEQIVRGRKYTVRYMLNGLVQHNIYHLGQVAYVKKFLVNGEL